MTRTDRQVGGVLLCLSVAALALWHTGRRIARALPLTRVT